MDDLVQFLRERLDEDEQAARAAAGYGDGAAHDVQGPPGTWALLPDEDSFGAGHPGGMIGPRIGYTNNVVLGAHIVRHDPARVLADIEAKRYYLELYAAAVDREAARKGLGYHDGRDPEQVDSEDAVTAMLEGFARRFAAVYCDHPDYRQEWKP